MELSELKNMLEPYSDEELRDKSIPGQVSVQRFEDNLNHSIASWDQTYENIRFMRHGRYKRHFFHAHDFLEVMFMYKGNGENYSDSGHSKLCEGDICLIPPGAWHLPIVYGDNILLNFCVKIDRVYELARQLRGDSELVSFLCGLNQPIKPKYIIVRSQASSEIYDCALRLTAAFFETHDNSRLERECIFTELMLKAAKLGNDKIEVAESFSTDELSSQIIGIISSDYRTLTLDELSERLSYSKSHICRVIKKASGTTFSNIVNQLRISDACRMLLQSGRSVSDIAYDCGFLSIEYFNRTFKHYISLSPSEYRKCGSESPNEKSSVDT